MPTHLTGSARFIHHKGKVIPKTQRNYTQDLGGTLYDNYLSAIKEIKSYNLPLDPDVIRNKLLNGNELADHLINYRNYRNDLLRKRKQRRKTYRLNKSKIRKKMSAFARLESSKKFLAFYSISFPERAPDNVLYSIFNSWLTNSRKRYNLKSYIWVAERQSNGTLHFHMLTNNYMCIQAVNSAMASAIQTEVNKQNITWGNSSRDKYNGVDVDSVQKPKRRQGESRQEHRLRLNKRHYNNKRNIYKWLIHYMTKYVTKNDIEFERLAYHSSRDISQLFTGKVINDNHLDRFVMHLSDNAEDYIVYDNEKVEVMFFRFHPDDALYELLDKTNEFLYYKFHNPT